MVIEFVETDIAALGSETLRIGGHRHHALAAFIANAIGRAGVRIRRIESEVIDNAVDHLRPKAAILGELVGGGFVCGSEPVVFMPRPQMTRGQAARHRHIGGFNVGRANTSRLGPDLRGRPIAAPCFLVGKQNAPGSGLRRSENVRPGVDHISPFIALSSTSRMSALVMRPSVASAFVSTIFFADSIARRR